MNAPQYISTGSGIILDPRDELRILVLGLAVGQAVDVAARSFLNYSQTVLTESIRITGLGTGRDVAILPITAHTLSSLAAVIPDTSSADTRVQVLIELRRATGADAPLVAILVHRVVTPDAPAAWPPHFAPENVVSHGIPSVQEPANPGLGTPLVVVVPAGERWEVTAITTQFNTSGTAGLRFPRLNVLRDGAATRPARFIAPRPQTPALALFHTWAANPTAPSVDGRHMSIGIPVLDVLAGGELRLDVDGFQVDDQFLDPVIWFERSTL